LSRGHHWELLFGAFGYIGQELAAHVSENFVEIYKGLELVANPPAQHPGWTVAYPDGRLSTRQSCLFDPHTGLLPEVGRQDRPVHLERGGTAAGGSATGPAAFGQASCDWKRVSDPTSGGSSLLRVPPILGDVRYRQIKT